MASSLKPPVQPRQGRPQCQSFFPWSQPLAAQTLPPTKGQSTNLPLVHFGKILERPLHLNQEGVLDNKGNRRVIYLDPLLDAEEPQNDTDCRSQIVKADLCFQGTGFVTWTQIR